MSLTRHPEAAGANVAHHGKGRFTVTEYRTQRGERLTEQAAVSRDLPDWLVREFTVPRLRRGGSLWWDYAYTPTRRPTSLDDLL